MKKDIIRVFVICCLILVVIAAAIYGHKIYSNKKNEIKTSIEPIADSFPAIADIESCYWYSEALGKSIINIGPTNYKLSAFIKISDDEKQLLSQKYIFTEKSVSFDDSLPISVLEVENPEFLYNEDLEKQILGNRFIGDVLFDLDNGIFYTSAQNL